MTVRAAPDIATTASPSARIGAPIHDTATLSGGFNPAGTIRFDLFGPGDVTCAGPPVFSSVVGVVPPADFNGDGRTDVSVFRPGSGQWFVRGIRDTVWGQAGDVPVTGDYNGDGTTDLAVFRPDTSTWFVRGLFETQYGAPNDVPLPIPAAIRKLSGQTS